MGISEAKSKIQQHTEGQNPAQAPGKTAEERRRIPLSMPMRKLEVPVIPGFHTRWIRGTPQRLAQAQRAGFEFASEEEVELNNLDLGGDASKAGNSDMGSRVSVIEGSEVDRAGNAVCLYLMKQKMEHYLEDRQIGQQRNDQIADALVSSFQDGTVGGRDRGETSDDMAKRYVKQGTRVPDLFKRKR